MIYCKYYEFLSVNFPEKKHFRKYSQKRRAFLVKAMKKTKKLFLKSRLDLYMPQICGVAKKSKTLRPVFRDVV